MTVSVTRNRVVLLVVLLVVGSLTGWMISRYTKKEPQVIHRVTSGDDGVASTGTTWVTEYLRGYEVFNYTVPKGKVYSWSVSYIDVITVAVPSYSQNFTLDYTESGSYNVYVPYRDVSVPVSLLGDYLNDETVLDSAYPLFSHAIRDIRVRAKIHEKPFGICGVVTKVFSDDWSTLIIGFVLNVDGELWAVVLEDDGRVMLIEELTVSVN
jgi:hypothetical protein